MFFCYLRWPHFWILLWYLFIALSKIEKNVLNACILADNVFCLWILQNLLGVWRITKEKIIVRFISLYTPFFPSASEYCFLVMLFLHLSVRAIHVPGNKTIQWLDLWILYPNTPLGKWVDLVLVCTSKGQITLSC